VPWCEECSKFWTPTSLERDGTCPSCGSAIAVAEPEPKAPWHFKLLVVAVVLYLGYRLVQGVEWLI
jgi:uncharacterized paraquat-inducible protein A